MIANRISVFFVLLSASFRFCLSSKQNAVDLHRYSSIAVKGLFNSMPEDKDIEESKLIAAVGYIGILCLIPLLGKKESKFAQFHGKQGLVLFICWVVIWVVGIIPYLGWFIAFFGSVVLLVLSIMGTVQALSGKYWELPYLAKYAEKIKL